MPDGSRDRSLAGGLLALGSAACFGTLAILVKFAYAAGVGVLELISTRFLVAAAALWLLSLALGRAPWRLPRRSLLLLAAMGSTLYSLQAFGYIYAVSALPASLVSLVLYTYPALVAAGAWAVFGRRLARAQLAALVASFLGLALLLGGTPRLEPSPALLAAALAPAVYTVYILAGDAAMRGADAIGAATVVMSCAAVTFTIAAAAGGELRPPASPQAAALLVAIGLVPTVVAITLFLASLPLIGAGPAALISTAEPLVTVGLAVLLLGERLGPVQAAGGAVLLLAVASLQWQPRRRAGSEPPARPTPLPGPPAPAPPG